MTTTYDAIGVGYGTTRRADPRLAAAITSALGDAGSVVNVGAGTGSYEPLDRRVIAIEPSTIMVGARPAGSAPAVRAVAETLPLADASVDAALAMLTIHHWDDVARGLTEMRRVARRRIVIFTWDPRVWETFWLVREYLPILVAADQTRAVPIARIESLLGPCRIETVPIPHDCADGFHGAFWRRPRAYLDANVRAGISSYAFLPARELHEGLGRLAADIESGAWDRDHADLLKLDALDLGYRLIVADGSDGMVGRFAATADDTAFSLPTGRDVAIEIRRSIDAKGLHMGWAFSAADRRLKDSTNFCWRRLRESNPRQGRITEMLNRLKK